MSRKQVSDEIVCIAYLIWASSKHERPNLILQQLTGEPAKVCFRAQERAEDRGLIDCGVSLDTGWLTGKGKEVLTKLVDEVY